ncbi:ABC transporter substrate-binding protein [Demequina zhanjiangensis]|uniref:ABC transporter substrate-binding protein n=1 Tax=Demequina zhanjiangensis TaxID=3051659 RepID=A0ABT8G4T4_9MICO|nr:ABC transporter substrate-binding protein [Demequina sp. SYSU T00b26]MDN4474150.1 ABC transporter substrate-binding protein [Demequina sp. SYSU T00b26]
MTARPRAVALLGAALALTLAACAPTEASSDGTPDAAGTSGTTVDTDTIRVTVDVPATFDPGAAQSLPDFVLARMSYDTLVRRDDSGLVPGLAASWESDHSSATFTLRDGLTCADGTPLTASVVKDSLDYMASSPAAIVNAGQVFGTNVPAIVADDDAGTVSITLDSPWPDMVTGLAMAAAGIVCPTGLADPEGLATGAVDGAQSGPYLLESAEPGVRYVYSLRDDYDAWPEWTSDVAGAPAETLEFVISLDSSATANLVLSDELDMGHIQPPTIERFDSEPDFDINTFPFSDTYVIFNERDSSPFADQAARAAVAQAIDRDAFNQVTTLGLGEVTPGLTTLAAQCPAPSEDAVIAYDAAAASEVLSGMTIRMIGPNIVGDNGSGNEYIAEALRAAGATVELNNTDVGTWISTLYTDWTSWDMTIYADLNFLGSHTSAVDTFLGAPFEEGGTNLGAVSNPDAEDAFAAFLNAPTDEESCAALNSSVEALVSNADTIPLVNSPFTYVERPGFTVYNLGSALDDPIYRIDN